MDVFDCGVFVDYGFVVEVIVVFWVDLVFDVGVGEICVFEFLDCVGDVYWFIEVGVGVDDCGEVGYVGDLFGVVGDFG